MNTTVLDIKKLTVNIGSQTLVNDVSLCIEPGQVVAVVGPNGAGKSTLINALSGDITDFQGALNFGGLPLKEWERNKKARSLAVLPQASRLNFPFTVREVVALGRIPHATGKTVDQHIVNDALGLADISHLSHRFYTELSGGEKQRTQIARVFAQIWREEDAPLRLLLLDEPTSALDLSHQQSLMRSVQAFTAKGVSVLMVVHDLNIALQYADAVLALSDGQQVAFGSPDEALSDEKLNHIFGTHIYSVTHPDTGKRCVIV